MEKLQKVGDLITQLGDALDDGKSISYSDFKMITNLKDRLIMCAALLSARGNERMTTTERDALNELRKAVDNVVEVSED